ncbi:elongation factor P [Desulfobaculum bizertense]|uniref:Elongation factor P n=1 Tax=Desulfobaculum bizertense DSM 18034 TaxID=1121442 RepID=A0A1T4W1X4_9BACT|nr:elongation factor P [Desulfobaculum bizertense]UIJ38878.1 elongation factor P [Desulfobaculum bizertense]SKA71252.1 translation elongation factor P (EF-P) [Desulfobaculum bizertense DSM 18034]
MISTADFKNGMKIELDGTPFEILEHQHHKPGKGAAVMRTRLRNLLTGRVIDKTFRSGEKVEKPDLETRGMQFLYHQGETTLVFMDMSSYEQMEVEIDQFGPNAKFLVDGQEVKIMVYKGRAIDLDMPASVVMEIAETEPGVRGDTVSGATKPATLSSGVVVNVPLFVNTGDMIKVDTRTGAYIGRE